MQDTTTITLPIPPDTLGIFALAVLLTFASYLIFVMLPPQPGTKHKSPIQRMEESFGIQLKSRLTAALLVISLFAYLMIFIFALFIALRGLGAIVFDALPEVMSPTQPRVSLAFGTLLAAILGAPFLIWRTYVAAKQTTIAEESLFNDKINAAATDLAARRQVTRSIGDGDTETILTEWQDDLVTRAAAIDRLEGLALERPDVAPRIARMLSIYVQELSREYPPIPTPTDASRDDLRVWADRLVPARTDMERAAQSLGQVDRNNFPATTIFSSRDIDLRRCNLQAFDLQDRVYDRVSLEGCNLAGARLSNTSFAHAKMRGVKLTGAGLLYANLQEATLRNASLEVANLATARMVGINLNGANFRGAVLTAASLKNARINDAIFESADLGNATFRCAQLRNVRFQDAYLVGTSFEGAILERLTFCADTHLDGASFRGAAMRFENPPDAIFEHWPTVFYSSSKIPDGAPLHWIEQDLREDEFRTTWRAFAASLNPPVTIQPDYNN